MFSFAIFRVILVTFSLTCISYASGESSELALDNFIKQIKAPSSSSPSYRSPDILFEPLHPAGVRISIPHQEGISSVDFSFWFENLPSNNIGQSKVRSESCRWILLDLTTRFKVGSVIYATVTLTFNNRKYTIKQKHVVQEFYSIDRNDGFNMGNSDCQNVGNNVNTGEELLPFSHPSPYIVTYPLTPSGVYIYIPHHEGISSVYFNLRFEGLNSESHSNGVIKFENNRWFYLDHSIKLNLGSIVYCSLQIIYRGYEYRVAQKHIVKELYILDSQELPNNNNGSGTNNGNNNNENGTNNGNENGNNENNGSNGNENNNNGNDGSNNNENNGNENNNNGNENNNNGSNGSDNNENNNGSNNNENDGNNSNENNGNNGNENNGNDGNENNNNNNGSNNNENNNGNGSNENESPDCSIPSATTLYSAFGFTKNPCTREVIFYEDFKNVSEFHEKWTVIEQFSGHPDYEFVAYRDSSSNINYDNGLKITPKLLTEELGDSEITSGELVLKKCTETLGSAYCSRKADGWNILPPVTSARINTKKAFNFEFGRIEVRAKFPRGDWIYPLIMLEPVRNFKESPLETLQIRIASASGNQDLKLGDGRDFSGRVLWGGITGLNPSQKIDHINDNIKTMPTRDSWSDAYHVYELIWNPNQLVLKVDGEDYGRVPNYLPSDTSFYLTVGTAVGGISEFPDNSNSNDSPKPWRNLESKALYNFYKDTDKWSSTWNADATTLNVDYIKIWAL